MYHLLCHRKLIIFPYALVKVLPRYYILILFLSSYLLYSFITSASTIAVMKLFCYCTKQVSACFSNCYVHTSGILLLLIFFTHAYYSCLLNHTYAHSELSPFPVTLVILIDICCYCLSCRAYALLVCFTDGAIYKVMACYLAMVCNFCVIPRLYRLTCSYLIEHILTFYYIPSGRACLLYAAASLFLLHVYKNG